MKKSAIFILILLILPVVSAVEFDMKTNFSQGETLMAKVSGNFLQPLQKDNIFFYREHVRIPLEYDIKKIDEDYYIYALLAGKEQNNYSVALENIRYMKGSEISQENIIRNFTINNLTADFSINPGFAKDNAFSIEVQNLQDRKITIEIKTKEDTNVSGEIYQEPITLKSGQKQEIDFIFETQEPVFKIIELSTENLSYEIPAYILATEILEQEIFKFEPSELIVSASTDSETKRTVYLYNTGNEAIKDIIVSLSNSLKPYATFLNGNISKLNANSNIPIELIFFSEDEFEVEGHIKAKQESRIIYSSISVKFLANYTPSLEPEQEYTTKTCAEIGYPICSRNEECSSQEVIYAKDNVCCAGTCSKKQTDSTGKIIGILIIIAAIIFLIWFFKKKYKGAKKPLDLLKIAKGKKK